MATKLVVLGIPWDVDTEGLKQYMSKFGELDDCIVMKERSSGRSRGFGYVTFASADDAKAVLESEHVLGNRTLEVKIATPREEMRQPAKKATRIFVARIPPDVTEAMFRSYFESYGDITDLYMPKVAIDSATPLDDAGPGGGYMDAPAEPFGGYGGGPIRNYGRLYGSLDFDDYGYGASGSSSRPSRMDWRTNTPL
ncbi:uncharacterized protein A4U43_C07F28210 [Asparagus officinalis]|uniref:RRM domain-containing protein n=1 Tax=Asparagus officinalis TaxID=4686 RepID=A0A5P1EFL7_ASPOF|nr:uncharacterized protein A4U43_C07F28210 [Asparagus officinalis]